MKTTKSEVKLSILQEQQVSQGLPDLQELPVREASFKFCNEKVLSLKICISVIHCCMPLFHCSED